ncbi:MAG: hypothetical protein J3K34DRAFT_524129 [Monoraphidium minutum]|nr:MAG: hypothetical protein J3K34DRAFT_524129 [Monoraphidium minutum]
MTKWILVVALALLVGVPGLAGAQKLGSSRCAILSGRARTLCTQFVGAKDSYTKYSTAQEWSRYETDSYVCAGITPMCLNDDMKYPRPFNTTCRVAAEGTPCGDNPGLQSYCVAGVCQYITGMPTPSRANVAAALDERARLYNAATTTFYPQAAAQQPPTASFDPNAPALNLSLWVDYDTIGRYIPASFIGISREYTNESVFWDRNLDAWGAILDVLGPSPVVRLGGASQEALTAPPTAEYLRSLVTLHCALGVRFIVGLPLFQNAPALALTIKQAFEKAFANFPRAIISYELGNEPNYWPSGSAGAFIWGTGPPQCAQIQHPTPFQNPSIPELVPNGAGMFQPPGSNGQAGNYYLYTKYRQPYQPFNATSVCYTPRTLDFYPGWQRYAQYFAIAANTVTGCNGPQTPEQALWARPYWGPTEKVQSIISGPAWGDLKIAANDIMQLVRASKGCFWNEATVHYYTPVANANATLNDLLDDEILAQAVKALDLIVQGVRNPDQAIDASQSSRVRITEAGSVSGGGKGGVSNTFAAAIWTAETAFLFSRVGAVGINYHWGNAGLFQFPGAEPAYIGVSQRFLNNDPNRPYPVVRAPWYGYVLFARATGNNGQAIALNLPDPQRIGAFGEECGNAVNMYPFLLPGTSEISVTIINKANNFNCRIAVNINGRLPDGNLTRLLPGKLGMGSTSGITWGGATYEGSFNGRMRGTPKAERVRGVFIDPEVGNWTTAYIIDVPPSSAALLLVPTADGAASASAPRPLSEEEQEQAQYEAQQRAAAGLYVPALPPAYGPLGTNYRAVYGSNAEAERFGTTQFALQSDGSYRAVNTPLPLGPVRQGAPADGGAGIRQAIGACPGIQKIATTERKGTLLRSIFTNMRFAAKRRRAQR